MNTIIFYSPIKFGIPIIIFMSNFNFKKLKLNICEKEFQNKRAD